MRTKLVMLLTAVLLAVATTACVAPTSNRGPATASDPGPAPASDPGPGGAGGGGDLVALINGDRAAAGRPALSWSPELGRAADAWASELAASGKLVHQDLGALRARLGWHAVAENIAQEPPGAGAGAVEAAWMASAPHRANILDARLTHVGTALATDASGRVWATADFGTP